ncbi:uncharacterized protein LOC142652550 [Rhinoderma darwinii]|uniref:uncharacterized protein LOC142652550 n=1 Tax=Rhinoderma darwinii TaxID=43563 RepID=UPI003F66DB8B
MLLDQGFAKPETISIQAFMTGMFFVTFASINICRRYWEMVKAARPESPFSRFVGNCPVQREERRVTVSMRNPHTPGKDITTLLKRFCTVVREPTHILNGLGFWTGKWSVIVRLNKDSSAEDGLQHLPQSFSLGNSYGLIYYPDMPQICRRCSKKGHSMKDCKEDACKNCRVTGHETKVKAARPESPFSRFVGNCPVQREERRVTVSMRNPHTPGKDITTLLKRFCTVVREPTHILNGLGFWTGKWSVIVRLNKDSSAEDGLQHLPQSFSLGNSYGLIYYPDMPQICRRCSKKGHSVKDCKEDACKNCRVTGHETKDCPKRTMCNLCGQAAHSYKDCPKRDRSWATAMKAKLKDVQPVLAMETPQPVSAIEMSQPIQPTMDIQEFATPSLGDILPELSDSDGSS